MTNAPPTDVPPTRHRILLVDDEELVLLALRETLLRAGYEIVTALTAEAALELLKPQTFSVVISDQKMPGMSGLDFLTRVKQTQPDTTRILLTGLPDLDLVIHAINRGEIYRFMVKPWIREELLMTVQDAVQRFELIRRNQELQAATLAMNEKLVGLNRSLEIQVARVADQNQQLAVLNQALAQNLQHSVELCLRTMQTFYPTLGSQARRVFGLCHAMGQGLRLSAEQQQTLEISAWLHDIGLVGVPRALIKQWEQEPAALSDAERTLIEHHPVLGEELAGFVHHLKGVGTTIRAHHERFDGTGYPDGLRGEGIPWLARLLAVAVAYAESNHKSDLTVELIKRDSGSAFDPEAVRVFLRCLPRASIPRKQREVLLSELAPGMVLAKGIYTANGMLLMPDGQCLNEIYIDKLHNHNRISPISQSLMVFC